MTTEPIRTHLFWPAGRNAALAALYRNRFDETTVTTYIDAVANELRHWYWRTLVILGAVYFVTCIASMLAVGLLLGELTPPVSTVISVAICLVTQRQWARRSSDKRPELTSQVDTDLGQRPSFSMTARCRRILLDNYTACGAELLDETRTWVPPLSSHSVRVSPAVLTKAIFDDIASRYGQDVADTVPALISSDVDGTIGDVIELAVAIAGEGTRGRVPA